MSQIGDDRAIRIFASDKRLMDVLLIGTNDLCAEMGIHGDLGNERVAEAYREMIAAARKHGKFPRMAGVYNETLMPRYIEMGACFILSGQDAAFFGGRRGPADRIFGITLARLAMRLALLPCLFISSHVTAAKSLSITRSRVGG